MTAPRALQVTIACVGLIVLCGGSAHALEPTQIFEKVSPSVWVVRTYDAEERPVGLGSAVVIGEGRLITNCHVLAKSKMVVVRRENVMYQAKLEHADAPRDLCLLTVANFNAPAVSARSVKELRVGERVYAIGNPKGLEVTLSEGLVSGLRPMGEAADSDSDTLVQTSAALSPGSSGGGLFDVEGRLVGVTTFGWRNAQNLNIALPTDWIALVPERSQAALAKRGAPSVAATTTAAAAATLPGYPAPGTVWVYRFTERLYSRRTIDITVRAVRADEGLVEESLSSNAPGSQSGMRVIDPKGMRFVEQGFGRNWLLVELAPYLLAGTEGKEPPSFEAAGYPIGQAGFAGWVTQVRVEEWEQITVPAGSFRALRIVAEGQRERPPSTNIAVAYRFKMNAWYSPEARRIVRLEHQSWSGAFSSNLSPFADEALELISYRPPQ